MLKIGIYVDSVNMALNGGFQMRYDVLRNYCSLDGDAIRLNAYVVYDEERAFEEEEYRMRQTGYFSVLRNFGYKVVIKPMRYFTDEEGVRVGKGNADLDMAVDIMQQSKNLDKVFLLTGDGDFKKVVNALQNTGTRVELIGFKNVSRDLQFESDYFTSGFIIPNLVPIEEQYNEDWGAIDFRARGVCYSLNENGYGFLRMLDLDFRTHSVFFHFTDFPRGGEPKLENVYEFTVIEGDKGFVAKQISYV